MYTIKLDVFCDFKGNKNQYRPLYLPPPHPPPYHPPDPISHKHEFNYHKKQQTEKAKYEAQK